MADSIKPVAMEILCTDVEFKRFDGHRIEISNGQVFPLIQKDVDADELGTLCLQRMMINKKISKIRGDEK